MSRGHGNENKTSTTNQRNGGATPTKIEGKTPLGKVTQQREVTTDGEEDSDQVRLGMPQQESARGEKTQPGPPPRLLAKPDLDLNPSSLSTHSSHGNPRKKAQLQTQIADRKQKQKRKTPGQAATRPHPRAKQASTVHHRRVVPGIRS